MSSLIQKFPETNKLTLVTVHENTAIPHVYRAYFADGTNAIIRTSNRLYKSVAQCGNGCGNGNTDFLFSSKQYPALSTGERARHIVTVPVVKA